MSSRRKSTTPCMVVPSDVVEQKAEGPQELESEVRGKEPEEQAAPPQDINQATVIVPTPPIQARNFHSKNVSSYFLGLRVHSPRLTAYEPSVSAVEDSDVSFPSLKQTTTSPSEEASSDQPSVEQQCDTPDEGSADPTNITAISLSKTPIMRMKTKSEPKRIAVIPSYSAAMDTNPLLGSTYKKFPYPSMAEISSLAAQTQFTEEQIKVWFSAQRLKHGVSWTPEEVEEARRKQFNGTVHTVPQTITVIPAHQLSAAANGLQSILQTCQIVGQSGLVFTQVSFKKENSALSADTFGMRPKKSKEQLAELKASYLKNHFVTDAEIARLMKLTNLTKGEIKKWFSDTRYNHSANATIVIDSSDETPTSPNPPHFTLQKFKEKTPEQLVVLEESFEKSSTPGDEELSRLRAETKLTRREIDAWFTERRKVPSATSPDSDGSKLETEEGVETAGSTKENQTPPGGQSKELPSTSCSSKDMKDKGKKSPEQLHMLKCAFVRNQWPTAEEYDQLAEESGLSRSYIVSWFGDSRYSWKNGNLKWFVQYQSGNVEAPSSGGGKTGVGRKRHPFQDPSALRPHGEGEDAHGPGGEQSGLGMGEDDDDDEDEEDGEDSDDSEVWEPSRSVRKSLSVSED
uniref:Zinc fingers and homeoboxes protein 1 n=1 Tax=Neogobius melanostomus TaxID=47308 RepID=A0A8C6SLS8_9GOBI